MPSKKRGKKPNAGGSTTGPTLGGGPGPGQDGQQKAGTSSAAMTAAILSTSSAATRSLADSYLLLVRLTNSSDPTITRILSIPADFTMAKVADVLTVAFGWAKGRHLSKFELNKLDATSSAQPVNRFFRQPILEIMDDESLENSQRIQNMMFNSHLFPRPPNNYKPPKLARLDDMSLHAIFEDSSEYYGGTLLSWMYDFGDGWEHTICLMGKEDSHLRAAMGIRSRNTAICLGGEGHPCAEDCGGSDGWERLKRVFADPSTEDPDGQREWYKKTCTNGDPAGLDPFKWDLAEVNKELMKIK